MCGPTESYYTRGGSLLMPSRQNKIPICCYYAIEPRRAPTKHQSTYPCLVPGKRLRITPSVFSGNFGPAQGGDYQMDSAEAMWVCPLYSHCDWPLSTSGLAIGVPSRLWNVAQCQLNACREVAFKQRRRHLPKAILICVLIR